jgi:hypothetical protein
MELSAEQQERYARHLLLDGFDQEKVLAASIRVRGIGSAALWAARYLAASGIGGLSVDDPSWREELSALGPWLRLDADPDLQISPAGSAADGCRAAAAALREVLSK